MNQPKRLQASQVMPGHVFYYSSPEDIVTKIKHYFVCVSRTGDEVIFMVCCTTQFDTVRNNIERHGFDFETMARIQPTPKNGLTKETFINCNNIYEKDITWLLNKIGSEEMEYKGVLESEYYEQVLRGIVKSDLAEQELIEDCEKQLDLL